MLFDLITAAKVSIKIECPNKILLFYRKFMFLQSGLKIAVCVPKIPIISKNCRLKISVGSKNFGISVGKPPEWCKCSGHLQRIAGSTGRKAGERQRESHKGRAGEDAGTHDHRRRAGEQQTNKFFVIYIGIEKYLQKS